MAHPLDPQLRTHGLEAGQRLGQRRRRRVLGFLSPLQLAQQQLRAGPFERHRHAIVRGHCCARATQRGVERPPRSQDHRAAPVAGGQHPGPVEPLSLRQQQCAELLGLVEAVQRHQRLGGVRQEPTLHQLDARYPRQPVDQGLQRLDRGVEVAAGHREEPGRHERPVGHPHRTRLLDGFQHGGAIRFGHRLLPPVGGHRGTHRQRDDVDVFAAELLGPVHRLLGLQRGLPQIPAPQRDQRAVGLDGHHVPVVTALQAVPADGVDLRARGVQVAGPCRQQGLHEAGPRR